MQMTLNIQEEPQIALKGAAVGILFGGMDISVEIGISRVTATIAFRTANACWERAFRCACGL